MSKWSLFIGPFPPIEMLAAQSPRPEVFGAPNASNLPYSITQLTVSDGEKALQPAELRALRIRFGS
jgi:hypothetical protein